MSETVSSFYAYRAEARLLGERRCFQRVATFGLLVEFCAQPTMPAHAKCAEHPDELNDFTLAQLHCLEVAVFAALSADLLYPDRIRMFYVRVALEILARTEPGARGIESDKLDWPAGARGRHRVPQVPAQIG